MAFVIVRIDVPGSDLGSLKEVVFKSSKPHETVNGLIRLLNGVIAGTSDAEVRVVVRGDTINDATLAAGSTDGAVAENFNLK